LASVPAGRVISYGRLAELAGMGRGARLVGRWLGQLPEDSSLPWHRVLNSQGKLSLPADSPAGQEQYQRLMAEGVMIERRRVNMRRFGWPD
ncbi:MAG: MGMT family protein, partial [Pseudomonas sp.]